MMVPNSVWILRVLLSRRRRSFRQSQQIRAQVVNSSIWVCTTSRASSPRSPLPPFQRQADLLCRQSDHSSLDPSNLKGLDLPQAAVGLELHHPLHVCSPAR